MPLGPEFYRGTAARRRLKPAYQKGAQRARVCLNSFARYGEIVDAVNPYTSAEQRADWQAGFDEQYSTKGN